MNRNRKPRAGGIAVVAGVILVLIGVVGVPLLSAIATAPFARLWMFGLVLGGLLLTFIGLGLAVSAHAFGILINGQNSYSLSRLQMAGWTWIILSALITVLALRLWLKDAALAFDIHIPANLLLVMGISYASGAAAPALNSLRQIAPEATMGQLASASARLGGQAVAANGQLAVRPEGEPPRFGDIVEGDDVASVGNIDLSKVQQLLITVMLLVGYLAMLAALLRADPLAALPETQRASLVDAGSLLCGYADVDAAKAARCGTGWSALPDFSASMLWLLALSHAGYLAFKVTPRPTTETANAPMAANAAPTAGRAWRVNSTADVSLRDGPGPAFREIGKLAPGTVLTVLAVEAGWAQVDTTGAGAPEGYMVSGYLKRD